MEIIAHWREAGEWWNHEPQREVIRYLDEKGLRKEQERPLVSLAAEDPTGQKELVEDHKEDISLRPRKTRDEKVSAANGELDNGYYEAQIEERAATARTRKVETRPDRRPIPQKPDPHTLALETSWGMLSNGQNLQKREGGGYAPLHVRSGYAFGTATMLAEEIASYAAFADCPACAIADPFSLVGALEFAKACKRNGLKPLIGASFELDFGGEIVLLAQNKQGYQNLSELITECHLSQPRLHPLASLELMRRFSANLICLTGGDVGPVNRLLISRKDAAAEAVLCDLVDIFRSQNVYVEMERSYLPWQLSVNQRLEELAQKHKLVCVAGGVVTHARPEHFPAQDILVCAETLCVVEEIVGRKPHRHPDQSPVKEFPARGLNAERFLKTSDEYARLFPDRPEWIENTLRVADRCEEDVMPGRTELPKLYTDSPHALSHIVHLNAFSLYPKITPKIKKRLDFEIERICRLGFCDHFLVAHDACRWAKDREIQLSGRGSVVDSAVAYCLGFSRIDAIRHNLHFDRFLPEDGSKRPDIDIDFESRYRDDVRNYFIRTYGREHVATVAAVGAFCTRGIIREVGKAMGLSPEVIGFMAKRIHGSVPPDQILSALERKPELRESNIPKEKFKWVFRLAEKLMDVPRNIRCHSSGVVVSATPLRQTVPVQWSAGASEEEANLRIIQWDKRSAKHYFDKFDLLCLRGQDVLGRTEHAIRAKSDPNFDVTRVPIDDPETYRTMRSGALIGIPQSASPAMRQAHIRIRTNSLDDASLVQAGIRPGVGGAVKMNELIARRRGKPYHFSHPELERILGHTYGIVVFQEQIDQLLQQFCGFTSGQAEDIRDAIHKRRREDYGQMIRDNLQERIIANGYSLEVALQVIEFVSAFKGYGFAQGHALAFAEISIRSIWCQQNMPAHYFSALLSSQPAGYYGPCTLVNEARSRGVRILPVDVTRSKEDFTVEDVVSKEDPKIKVPDAGIRVSLSSVQGLSTETRSRIYAWAETLLPEQTKNRTPSENAKSPRL